LNAVHFVQPIDVLSANVCIGFSPLITAFATALVIETVHSGIWHDDAAIRGGNGHMQTMRSKSKLET